AGCELSSTVTSAESDFSHTYLVGARFYCLRGEMFAYLGRFRGAIFADGDNRIDVANVDFSQISGLIDGQFMCYYKSNIALPTGVECVSVNRFAAAREATSTVANTANATTAGQADWGDGYVD
ncbi:MAG: hypothetical protein AAFY17_04320, partial [Cyanobacteria bacterium J06642_11]